MRQSMSAATDPARPAATDAGQAAALPAERVWFVKAVLVAAWLAGLLLSLPLWTQDRSYPLAPVIPDLEVSSGVARGLLIGLFGLLAAALFAPRPRWLLLAAALLAVLLALLDQTRWQPWYYQYLVMAVVLGVYGWDARPPQRRLGLDACRVILAGTYFWSGAQKLNVTFANEGFPWLLAPWIDDPAGRAWLPALAWSVPFVEAGFALTLLTRWRRWGVCAVVAMHLFILLSLGPLGRNWNIVVWPWNGAMVLLVIALFWHAPGGSVGRIVRGPRSWAARGVLLLFGLLPGLNFVDLWDAYLSASLYSGSIPRARLWISPQMEARLPAEIRPYVTGDTGRLHIDLFRWSFAELGVPPYPASRVYRVIAGRLCACAGEPRDLVLVVGSRPDWRTGRRRTSEWDCAQLAASAGKPAPDGTLENPGD